MATGTTEKPVRRQVKLLLNGDDNQFHIPLDGIMKENNFVGLVGYTVLNTPVTAGIPDTPILRIEFPYGAGFELTPMITNVPYGNGIIIPLTGISTQRTFSPPQTIGGLRGGARAQITVTIQDYTGAAHNASSNKLFDWLFLELEILESGRSSAPLSLYQLADIQNTWNTI